MGSRLATLRRWPVLLFALVATLVLALSGGVPPRAAAQDVPGGTVSIKFSMDTLPIAVGVLCRDMQYKILFHASQAVGKVQKPIHAGIELVTALNRINPRYLDIPENDPEGVAYYDAQNIGHETIAYTAYEKTILTSDAGVQPQIAEGHLEFDVKECPYTVTLVYALQSGSVTVSGIMAEVRLARNKDGTYEADGPFEFQQMLNAPCPNDFTGFDAPTHITGTVDSAKRELNLKFKYSPGTTTFTVTCPIVGSRSASHSNDPTSLGVTNASFPLEGGFKVFPAALGGQFMVAVNQEAPE